MNILSIKRLISMLILTTLAASCATYTMTSEERTQAYDDYIETEKLESIKRIASFRFDSWSSLGDKHLIISTRFNKPYLITLRSRCPELRTANAIQIHNTGSILQAGLDSVSAFQGPNNIRCHIRAIHILNMDQKKYLRQIGRENESEEIKE